MVQDADLRRFYLSYDASRIEPYETLLHNILIGGVFVFSFSILWLGLWPSGRVISPDTSLADDAKLLRADADAEIRVPQVVLNTVLGNLLDNAIAETDKGEILLTLDVNGITIADTAADNLSYVQPDNHDEAICARTESKGERGLGVSIVKQLCERYGWRIEVRRSKESGSTARLIIAD